MNLSSLFSPANLHGSSQLSRIDYLDGWRGLAILFVLVGHFMQTKIIDVGRLGVDVFFVLSGMLMANLLFVKKVELKTFYKRRVSRIIPIFFIYLTIVSFASWIFSISNEHSNYFYNLFFMRAYLSDAPHMWVTGIPIGHLWSLNVEEHCYIILSLLTVIPFLKTKPYVPILCLGIGSILLHYSYVIYPEWATPNFRIKTEINASFIMLSAGYFLIKHRVEKHIPSWLPLMTFSLAIYCYSEMKPHWTAAWSLAPILLAFSVNHLNLIPKFFESILCLKPLRLLGIWSFSIYLWQQPFYLYGTKGGESYTLLGLFLLIISIAVGALSFYAIENPARKYLNEKW